MKKGSKTVEINALLLKKAELLHGNTKNIN